MLKRICDRCKEEIESEYYSFEITHMVGPGRLGAECYFDLCPKCYKETFGLIDKEIENGEV